MQEFIGLARAELKDRANSARRKVEQIRQIAATAKPQVSFARDRSRAKKNGAALKAGTRDLHPTDPGKV